MRFRTICAAFVALSALPLVAQSAPPSSWGKGGPDVTSGILGTAQAERLSFKATSSGFKVLTDLQWKDWLGLDMRGTAITFSDNNHTFAFEAGPRFAHRYGPVIPYAEIVGGPIHQYYYGGTVGGIVGGEVHLARGLYWTTEGEYRFAPQKSTPSINPVRSRVELSTGIVVRIDWHQH